MVLILWDGVPVVGTFGDLLEAEVSQRHISFIESGRSVPTRHMLPTLAQTLDIPFRERNLLLPATPLPTRKPLETPRKCR